MAAERATLAWCVAASLLLAAGPATAASLRLDLPGVTGEHPTPGHPDAMLVDELTLAPNQLTVVKGIDAASTELALAVSLGTLFPTAQLLFYDATPGAQPDAEIALEGLFASAYLFLDDPVTPREQVELSSATPALLALELPGIPGENDLPGHPDTMLLESFSTGGASFAVTKPVDAASPAIQNAVATGTAFPSAQLLVYDDAAPSGPPDAIVRFASVFATSWQLEPGGGEVQLERVGFAFASLPEPDGGALGAASLAALAAARRRRSPR
jgi:MYXO-CTERM domain-containing protein